MALFQINPRHTMPDEMLAGFMSMPMLQEGFQNSHSFEMRRWSKIKNGFTHFQNGDIVIAKITPCFQNRKSAIISGLPNDCGAGSTELHVLRDVTGLLFMPFFLWIFKTHLFIEDGKKHFTGTAGQQRIGKDFISTYLIPLPSLFEQERIVAKIEELLPHIEEYDRVEQKLDKLNTEFPEQLKKSILQWAIQGKLLPQNSNDEPASVLLERIRAEKAKLIKEGKIKKDKEESVIFRRDNSHYEKLNGVERCIDDEIPFEIPNSWAWTRCGMFFQLNPRNTIADDVMVGFIPMSLLLEGFQSKHSFETRKWKDVKKGFTHLQDNDIVIAKITPCFQNRKSAVLANLPNHHGAGTTELHVLRDKTKFLSMNFFLWIFKSHLFIEGGKKNFTGTAGQQRISKNFISDFLLPVPPITEQKRIVEAIELLLCKLGM